VSARSGALFHGFAPSEVLVAVGVYVDDAAPSRWAHVPRSLCMSHVCELSVAPEQAPSRWAYWAELQTPLERLVET